MTEPEGPAPKQETLQRIDKGYSRAFTLEPKIRRIVWRKQQAVKTRAFLMSITLENAQSTRLSCCLLMLVVKA